MEEKKTLEEKAEKKSTKKKKKGELTVKANKKGRHKIRLLTFLHIVGMPIYRLIRPFRLYGNKKVADGACVYVCNHYGMFDPAYPIATTWEGIHFVAKRELFEAPVIGGVLRGVKAISANRDGNDVRVLLDCFKCLKNNEKICIFPEGTRNRTGAELGEMENGAAAIAIKAKTPILPMMLYKKPRCFRVTHVLVGEPFELSEYYNRKLTEVDLAEANAKVREKMLSLRREHTEFLESKKAKKTKKKKA